MAKKWKAALAKAKNRGLDLVKGEGIGKMGHETLEVTGNLALAVADKKLGELPIPFSPHPSTVVLVASAAGMLLGKGKTKRYAKTALKASLGATIGRLVWNNELGPLTSGPVVSGGAPAKAAPPAVSVHIGNDAVKEAVKGAAKIVESDDAIDTTADDE